MLHGPKKKVEITNLAVIPPFRQTVRDYHTSFFGTPNLKFYMREGRWQVTDRNVHERRYCWKVLRVRKVERGHVECYSQSAV